MGSVGVQVWGPAGPLRDIHRVPKPLLCYLGVCTVCMTAIFLQLQLCFFSAAAIFVFEWWEDIWLLNNGSILCLVDCMEQKNLSICAHVHISRWSDSGPAARLLMGWAAVKPTYKAMTLQWVVVNGLWMLYFFYWIMRFYSLKYMLYESLGESVVSRPL